MKTKYDETLEKLHAALSEKHSLHMKLAKTQRDIDNLTIELDTYRDLNTEKPFNGRYLQQTINDTI